MTGTTHPPVTSVALLVVKQTTPGTLYALYEVLASAGVAWPAVTGEATDAPRLDVRIVSADGAPFAGVMGVPVAPHASLAASGAPDVIIATDLDLTTIPDPRGLWPVEAAWLARQWARGAMLVSVCTGAVLLAEAGVLDGAEATTHWSAAGLFRDLYPAVRLHPERVLCPAGEAHRLVTSGGAASWEDLALYLVGRFCGAAEAVRVAKLFLLGDRSAGQSAFAAMARPRRHEDAAVAKAQAWIAEHYAGANPVAGMVRVSGLAERSFKRRFRAATGYAPIDYVQALRIEEAKQLLERSALGLEEVAAAVGYEDPASFRRLFRRRTGVSPARYRRQFGGAATTAIYSKTGTD
jgi:transcriptional regulator GlxA family with amidase domain